MKSKISIILLLFIISTVYTEGETIINKNDNPQHQHTFLVKTDLTKEQVETLLNQYHQRKNKNQVETTTLKHKNSTEGEIKTELHTNEVKSETTQLKAKKEKKNKEERDVPKMQETLEAPKFENTTETTSLKKKGKKKRVKTKMS